MALHHELPIYRDARGLYSHAIKIMRNFPRDVKRQLGSTVLNECMEVMILIFRANVAQNKVPHIEQMQERLLVAEELFRTSRDERFITLKQYSDAIELTQSIGRQSGGWKKQSATGGYMNPCGNNKCNEINAGIDKCIQHLIKVLNDNGYKTVASCCGHGNRPGNIALADGRELIIAPDWESGRKVDRCFPDIHGSTHLMTPQR